MPVEIRDLASTDRDALEGVLRSDTTFVDAEIAVALELIDEALAKPDGDYWIRVAVVDGEVGGYICYGPTPMTRSTYDLYWIVSHARARGRGVARALVEAMEADLLGRGVSGIRVETSVKESHGPARKLYDRLAYPELARFADFYAPGDDLIVYYKRFDGGERSS